MSIIFMIKQLNNYCTLIGEDYCNLITDICSQRSHISINIIVYTINPTIPAFLDFINSWSPQLTIASPKRKPEIKLPKCPKKSTPGISEISRRVISIKMILLRSSFMSIPLRCKIRAFAMKSPITAQIEVEAPMATLAWLFVMMFLRSNSILPE